MPPKRAKKSPKVGDRRIRNGKEQIYLIQGGRGFWGDAWNFVKKAAGGVHDVVKKSGIIGNTLATLPGFAGKAGGPRNSLVMVRSVSRSEVVVDSCRRAMRPWLWPRKGILPTSLR